MKYSLRLIAPDGACVTEGRFESVEAAWDRFTDMGSRWIFYPIAVVTGPSSTDRARIVDVLPEVGSYWKGCTLRRFRNAISERADDVCSWINEGALCPL